MIAEKIILWNTNYGEIKCNLKQVMIDQKVSLYQVCRLSGLKYEVVIKYYNNTITRFDSDVVAKLCFVLGCQPKDIIVYVLRNN